MSALDSTVQAVNRTAMPDLTMSLDFQSGKVPDFRKLSSLQTVNPYLARGNVAGVGGANYQNIKNYNLQVLTSESPQVVQSSFKIMEVMAA